MEKRRRNILGILLYLGGILFFIIGVLMFIFLGYNQEISLTHPVIYLITWILSFLFICFGFFTARFSVWITDGIIEFSQKEKKPQT